MTPQFDTYLLHLPPINLNSIGLLYRYKGEFHANQTEKDSGFTMSSKAPKTSEITRVLGGLLRNR